MQVVCKAKMRHILSFMVNELVNKNFEEVYKHPELQWLLMSMCGTGKIELILH